MGIDLTLLTPIAALPCEASAFYDIAEDGVSRCIDPEFTEGPPVGLCAPCAVRKAVNDAPGIEAERDAWKAVADISREIIRVMNPVGQPKQMRDLTSDFWHLTRKAQQTHG